MKRAKFTSYGASTEPLKAERTVTTTMQAARVDMRACFDT